MNLLRVHQWLSVSHWVTNQPSVHDIHVADRVVTISCRWISGLSDTRSKGVNVGYTLPPLTPGRLRSHRGFDGNRSRPVLPHLGRSDVISPFAYHESGWSPCLVAHPSTSPCLLLSTEPWCHCLLSCISWGNINTASEMQPLFAGFDVRCQTLGNPIERKMSPSANRQEVYAVCLK